MPPFSTALPQLSRRDVLTGVGCGAAAGVVSLGILASVKRAAIDIPAIVPDPPALPVWPTLDALTQGMIDTRAAPGFSLALMKDGQLLYSHGFGRASVLKKSDVTPHTGFRIASISKQFTASAILLLAEEGRLAIDDPLSKFIPDFPRADEMSLRQLLSHTAGLEDYLSGRHADTLSAAQTRDYSATELLDVLLATTPMFRCPPGVKWIYSNTGFALLGIIVERLSGLPFGDFLAQRLFTPAGMTRTALDPVVASDSDLCEGHRANGSAAGFGKVSPVSPSFAGGSGGLRSTAEDLCRWHSALFGGKILKPASLAQMTRPTRLNDGSFALDRSHPTFPAYGLGLRVGFDDGRLFFTHSGRINGFTGQLMTFPAEKLTFAVLYNCDGALSATFGTAASDLRREALRLGLSG